MTDEEQQRWKRIDERQQAINESVELLTLDIREMQAHQKRLDARERRARKALMTGIAAYLDALEDNGNGENEG